MATSLFMRLTLTRWFLFVALVFSGIFLGGLIFGVDPTTLTKTGIAAFFALVFLFLMSGLMLMLLSLSERFLGRERTAEYQLSAWRQSSLIAFLLVALLLAQYGRVLAWWGVLLGLALILLIELTARRLTVALNR